ESGKCNGIRLHPEQHTKGGVFGIEYRQDAGQWKVFTDTIITSDKLCRFIPDGRRTEGAGILAVGPPALRFHLRSEMVMQLADADVRHLDRTVTAYLRAAAAGTADQARTNKGRHEWIG